MKTTDMFFNKIRKKIHINKSQLQDFDWHDNDEKKQTFKTYKFN